MTGSVQTKRGLLYIVLSYKQDEKWKTKWINTHLREKGNKRKAEAMKSDIIEKYSYLEIRASHVSDDILIPDFVNYWLKSIQGSIEQSTYEGYVYRAKKICSFPPFNMEMRKLKPEHVDAFCREMLLHGKTNQKTKASEPLAVRTVREYKNVLFAVCNKAVSYGLLKSNPCRDIRVSGKTNRAFEEELLFLKKEELADLIRFMKEDDTIFRKLAPITFIGAYYGLRRSEILGLTWDAVDFEKKVIRIKRTVVRVKTVQEKDNVKTKSSKRELALFPTAERMLRQLQSDRDASRKFYGRDYHESPYVFVWDDGRQYDPNYITRTFKKATEKFGRPGITLHKLRHTCASLLLDEGWDIKKVQYWLGHSDAQVTLNIYAHYMKHRMNEQADDLEEIASLCTDLF